MTDARVSPPVDAARRGFKPVSRRRNRIALGVLLAAIAIGAKVNAVTVLSILAKR